MGKLYFSYSAFDGDNVEKGFEVAKLLLTENDSLDDFVAKEMNLMFTGWAPNSFNFTAIGMNDEEDAIDQFLGFVQDSFSDLLLEKYNVTTEEEIEFDDEDFDEEFDKLIQHIKAQYKGYERKSKDVHSIELNEQPKMEIQKSRYSVNDIVEMNGELFEVVTVSGDIMKLDGGDRPEVTVDMEEGYINLVCRAEDRKDL